MKAPSRQVPATAKLVLCALLDLRELGVLNPKIELLERQTGETRDAVRWALRRLRRSGLIQTVKGQRQNSYQIVAFEDWEKILPGVQYPAEADPAGCPTPGAPVRKHPAETALPYIQDFSSRPRDIEKEGSRGETRKLSTRERGKAAPPPPPLVVPGFDPNPVLEECREIYQRAGVPLSPNQERLARELILALDPETRSRIRPRLLNYLKWAIVSGRWDSPQFTKSLVNVLRDGDWDVEIVMRDLPTPRKPTHSEEQKRLYYEREARLAAYAATGRKG